MNLTNKPPVYNAHPQVMWSGEEGTWVLCIADSVPTDIGYYWCEVKRVFSIFGKAKFRFTGKRLLEITQEELEWFPNALIEPPFERGVA